MRIAAGCCTRADCCTELLERLLIRRNSRRAQKARAQATTIEEARLGTFMSTWE